MEVLSKESAYSLMFMEYPDVMNVKQMSSLLGISIKTGYRLIQEDKVKYLQIGRSYRIPKAYIFDYLKIGN